MKHAFAKHTRIAIPQDKLWARLAELPTGHVQHGHVPVLLANQYHGDTFPPCLISGGPEAYVAALGEPVTNRIYLYTNAANHSATMKGEWWYSGTYTVKFHDLTSSELHYEVANVAHGWTRPLGRLMARRARRRLEEDFLRLAKQLSSR